LFVKENDVGSIPLRYGPLVAGSGPFGAGM